jgi:hypothetical protein
MDSAALTALVDRWHPETHTFHLACGETTVMLQDVVMILGLPIDGHSVGGPMSPGGWRDSVGAAISIHPPPPDLPIDKKEKKPSGIHSSWLTTNFDTYPKGAEDMVDELCFSILIQFVCN